MANMTIDEATPDTSIGGAEKIPVSDAGVAKSITTQLMKQYVVDAIGAITSAESVDLSNDKIYLGAKNGAKYDLKPISGETLCDAVYALMFDKEAVGTFDSTDKIAVENGGATKTTTLGALADYIVANKSLTFNIHDLEANNDALVDADEIAYAHGSNSVYTTLKKSLVGLYQYVLGKLHSYAVAEQSFSNIQNLICTTSQGVVKKVPFANLNVGVGDVKGPGLNNVVNNNIPLWDKVYDETEQKLKAGLAVLKPSTSVPQDTTISSQSGDGEIPTAKNVYLFGKDMVRWGTETGGLNAGCLIISADNIGETAKSTVSVERSDNGTSTISDSSTNNRVPTSLNVYHAIKNSIKCSSATTVGYVPQWNNSAGTEIKPGLQVTEGSLFSSTISADSTNTQIPTALNVYAAVKDNIKRQSTSTVNGAIPVWNGNDGLQLAPGREIISVAQDIGDYRKIPTWGKVDTQITSLRGKSIPTCTMETMPDIADVENGEMVLYQHRADGGTMYLYAAYKPSWDAPTNYKWMRLVFGNEPTQSSQS